MALAVYDSANVRRVAAQMRQLTGSMESGVKSGLFAAVDCLEGLCGRTAQAMGNRLDELIRISGGLQKCRIVSLMKVRFMRTDA